MIAGRKLEVFDISKKIFHFTEDRYRILSISYAHEYVEFHVYKKKFQELVLFKRFCVGELAAYDYPKDEGQYIRHEDDYLYKAYRILNGRIMDISKRYVELECERTYELCRLSVADFFCLNIDMDVLDWI